MLLCLAASLPHRGPAVPTTSCKLHTRDVIFHLIDHRVTVCQIKVTICTDLDTGLTVLITLKVFSIFQRISLTLGWSQRAVFKLTVISVGIRTFRSMRIGDLFTICTMVGINWSTNGCRIMVEELACSLPRSAHSPLGLAGLDLLFRLFFFAEGLAVGLISWFGAGQKKVTEKPPLDSSCQLSTLQLQTLVLHANADR